VFLEYMRILFEVPPFVIVKTAPKVGLLVGLLLPDFVVWDLLLLDSLLSFLPEISAKRVNASSVTFDKYMVLVNRQYG